MSDDDLIRRGDALYAIAGWEIPSTAIAALPAVTVGDALAADRDAQKALADALKNDKAFWEDRENVAVHRAEAAEAKVARLVEALTLAANRLSRRAVEYVPGSRLFIETGEWADEARAIIAEVEG